VTTTTSTTLIVLKTFEVTVVSVNGTNKYAFDGVVPSAAEFKLAVGSYVFEHDASKHPLFFESVPAEAVSFANGVLTVHKPFSTLVYGCRLHANMAYTNVFVFEDGVENKATGMANDFFWIALIVSVIVCLFLLACACCSKKEKGIKYVLML